MLSEHSVPRVELPRFNSLVCRGLIPFSAAATWIYYDRLRRVVGADTYTPLAGAAFLVIPSEADIVAAAALL